MTENEEEGDVSIVVAQNLLYVAARPTNLPVNEIGPFEFAGSLEEQVPGLIYSIVIFFALLRPFNDPYGSFLRLNMVQEVVGNAIDSEHKRARLFVCIMQSAELEKVVNWIVGLSENDRAQSTDPLLSKPEKYCQEEYQMLKNNKESILRFAESTPESEREEKKYTFLDSFRPWRKKVV